MKKLAILTLALLALVGCKKSETESRLPYPTYDTQIRGADLSYLPAIEQAGVTFANAKGEKQDMLSILQAAGCNTVRVRLWNNPTDGHSSLAEVAAFAVRIKAKGMKVWLDFHYSDTWADPAKQVIPQAWSNLNQAVLADSVYRYTKKVMQLVKPEIVQIGNEINNGILGDRGSLASPTNIPNFIELLKSGIRGAREAYPTSKILIHYAGYEGAEWFFATLLASNNIDYNLIGLSYYPYFHGKDTAPLTATMQRLAAKANKQVVIAETAYPFTLQWNDYTNNVVGTSDNLTDAYPPTPEGQKAYLLAIRAALRSANGLGFCYWGGEWVAYKGAIAKDGSSWENQALFDFQNRALPVLEAFKRE